MLLENLNALSSPSSQETLKLTNEVVTGGYIDSGILHCKNSEVIVPIVNGFVLHGEVRPWSNQHDPEEWLQDLKNSKFSKTSEYTNFLKEKSRRGSSDAYAAFQPFNESSRALYPFISILKETLNPGDIILDTWCRSGWTGELLAGLFPEQRIISLWEGDSNVLGYRGFDYWLNSAKRQSNLEIMFTHPDKPLPFATNSIRMVHGLDSLHRYSKDIFLNECLRVCENDGLLIFPHIHLTNSEPEPFFERGCQQYHGKEWKARVDAAVLSTKRRCWILPEVELFDSEFPLKLSDDSETNHYNALILIAPEKFDNCKLADSKHLPLNEDFRLIQNPLFNIDLNQGTVSADSDRLGGFAPEMLSRHPCYDKHLRNLKQSRLTADEIRLLWQAQNGLTLDEISKKMKMPIQAIYPIASSLCNRELVHAAPISKSMWNLQTFYGFVQLPQEVANEFSEVWQNLDLLYQSQPMIHWLEDGSELIFDDVEFLVSATRVALQERNINSNTRISLASSHHPAALILCWACWLEGVCVILLDEDQPAEKIRSLQLSCDAHWLFTDNPLLINEQNDQSILFDTAETANSSADYKHQLFSSLLESYNNEKISSSRDYSNSDAVILFSSGSSGESKRIVITQKALCTSGFNMASTFNWKRNKILSLGPFSMMSGLRNPMVASIISGSTIFLPGRETTMPINAWQQVQDNLINIVTTVPSWLEILLEAGDRLKNKGALKQVLVTGSQLKSQIRDKFSAITDVIIEDYYGLTETGGLCATTCNSDTNKTINERETSIGYPAGAVINITNDEGELVNFNQSGLLRVYSNQLMDRYLDDPSSTENSTENGWFLTGDLAYWDDGGRIILIGRNDDLLKLRDGSRMHPCALEELLTELPGVNDAAVLITEPFNSLLGLVVTKKNPEELLNSLKKQHPNEKLPDKLKCVTSLPYNRNGKLQRTLLHELSGDD